MPGLPPDLRPGDRAQRDIEKRREGDRKLSREDKGKLQSQLQALLDIITKSSVEAQTSVRSSSNDPKGIDASQAAIRLTMEAAQVFANLFPHSDFAPQLPRLVEARMRYREVVGDDDNLAISERAQKDLRCETIESACAHFHEEISIAALGQFGIKLGRRLGRAAR